MSKLIKTFNLILYFLMFSIPIYSLVEIFRMYLFFDNVTLVVATPIYIKLLKDFLIILLIIISFVCQLKTNKSKAYWISLIVFCTFIILLSSLSIKKSIAYPLAGARWIYPLFLIFLFRDLGSKKQLQNITKILLFIFLLHFIFQLTQVSYMLFYVLKPDVYMKLTGYSVLTKLVRYPGIFSYPNTASLFLCLTAFSLLTIFGNSFKRNFILLFIIISLILTKSGTGILAISLFLILYFFGKQKYKIWLYIFLTIFTLSLLFLPEITMRYDVYESLLARFQTFTGALQKTNYISSNFGWATNSSLLLSTYYKLPIKNIFTDSFFTNLLINVGVIGFFIFIFISMYYVLKILKNKNKELICLLPIIFLFSMTSSITEVFPANILIPLYLSRFLFKS